MIVTTINVNGIRAAVKERSAENLGLLPWLGDTSSDVVCLQETRADDAQLTEALAPALDAGWHLASAEPHMKGRNGVAVLSRTPIAAVRIGLDDEFASHGRYLEADTADVTVASVYVPTGEAETDKQVEKERFMAALATRMAELSRKRRGVAVCGDWNIAACELDIKAWKNNVKKSGFLPSERQWLAELMASGWTDVVRELHPDIPGPYSWWSWRGKAFDNDAGWRIDYHLANAKLAPRAVAARVERAEAYALRWSDHAPVTVHYEGSA
ncbi:exodeoxyribonuclease-3 [Mycobacterium sp. MAA66]|uniref:exodeoxyribonuclease III n=1 Tax=Mycobacterium sp. MAA66 TaxID=3156297 RepID=UPI003513BCA5